MRCSDFLERLAETYGYESRKTIKATFFVDGVMRRLDRLLYDVEKEADHTLKSLCVGNDSQIVIELKTEEEIKAEEDNASKLQTDFIDSESKVSTIQSETAMDVDKTENIRSVLLHKEEDPQFLERFNVDLNWTIEQLLSKLKQFVGVPESEERRLRREIDNSLIVKEELKIPLKEYPEFQEGGVRLKLEFGRFPSVEELAITVALYGDLDFQQRFYLFKESSVGEGKIKICEGFGVDPNNYKLWRVDMYDEPIYVCKKERQTWEKNMVSNGDLLILKSEADILPEEQCIIDIHETITGIPNDCKAVGHITMRDSDTIESLKESILEMEELRDKEELDNFPLERVRLRIRSRNLFFGKIIRENNKSLKQLKIKSGTHLVVQFLSEPEHLKNNEMILLLRKRDLKAKEYHEFIQFKYSYEKMPTLNHLKSKVSEVTGISKETMSIAKYIPHEYDWKYWDPAREIEIKKKNKKGNNKKGKGKGKQKGGKKGDQKQQDSKEENKEENKEEQKKEKTVELKKLVDFDLRTSPLLLSEGDILGVRDDTEEGALEDDFQTEADIQNKIRLEELKKIELLDKGKEKSTHYDDPFKIYTDF